MIEAKQLNLQNPTYDSRTKLLLGALLTMLGVVAAVGFWFLYAENILRTSSNLYLLPWIVATGLVLAAPTVYSLYRGKFDFFHPLIIATWSFWFPSFVGGGFLIATNLIYPFQVTLLNNPETDLAWTYFYIIVGYASMAAGFYLPWSKKIGQFAARQLPLWDWQPRQVLLPAAIFLGTGLFFYISSFISGVVGYSINTSTDAFSTLNYTLSLFTLQAGFLTAMYIFKAPRISPEHLIAFAFIGIILISRLSLGGNRSSILLIVTLMAMAYVYAGRKFTVKQASVFGALAVLAVLAGMIYGTTFRNLKDSQDRVSINQQLEIVSQTFDTIGNQDTEKVFLESLTTLGERIDNVSSLGVVVSNYEKLAPYEASYGIENNIFTDLWASLIPRFLWQDKPNISDVRAYSDLYFNFGDNSFALTPIGDLLRNFGAFGVPVGMLIVGIFLRFAYAMLIEDQAVTIGRATAYYMFLVSFSYEGFYASIFIYGGRILAICFVTFVLVDFFLIGKKRL
jgi:hypothetical protein